MAHAHARERRADVPCGPWRGKGMAWEGARRGLCTPHLGHEGAHWPVKARPQPEHCPWHPAILLAPAGGFDHSPVVTEPLRSAGQALPMPATPASCSAGALVVRPGTLHSAERQAPIPCPDREPLSGVLRRSRESASTHPLPWFSPPEGTDAPGPCYSDQKAKETPGPAGKAHLPPCALGRAGEVAEKKP